MSILTMRSLIVVIFSMSFPLFAGRSLVTIDDYLASRQKAKENLSERNRQPNNYGIPKESVERFNTTVLKMLQLAREKNLPITVAQLKKALDLVEYDMNGRVIDKWPSGYISTSAADNYSSVKEKILADYMEKFSDSLGQEDIVNLHEIILSEDLGIDKDKPLLSKFREKFSKKLSPEVMASFSPYSTTFIYDKMKALNRTWSNSSKITDAALIEKIFPGFIKMSFNQLKTQVVPSVFDAPDGTTAVMPPSLHLLEQWIKHYANSLDGDQMVSLLKAIKREAGGNMIGKDNMKLYSTLAGYPYKIALSAYLWHRRDPVSLEELARLGEGSPDVSVPYLKQHIRDYSKKDIMEHLNKLPQESDVKQFIAEVKRNGTDKVKVATESESGISLPGETIEQLESKIERPFTYQVRPLSAEARRNENIEDFLAEYFAWQSYKGSDFDIKDSDEANMKKFIKARKTPLTQTEFNIATDRLISNHGRKLPLPLFTESEFNKLQCAKILSNVGVEKAALPMRTLKD